MYKKCYNTGSEMLEGWNSKLRAGHTRCVCVTSRTWNDFYRMRLIRQFCSERTWTLQKLTHPSL